MSFGSLLNSNLLTLSKEIYLEIEKLAGQYVAHLRSLYLLHQNHHWLSKGDIFYAHHLLFERIYQSAQEHADEAAEKMIGVYGIDCLDKNRQAELISTILKKYTGENLVEESRKAEEDFLMFSANLYNLLEDNDLMTLGVDDMIASIANGREEAVYLLKQTLGDTAMSNNLNKMSKLASKFQKKIAQDISGSEPAGPNMSTNNDDLLKQTGDKIRQNLIQTLGLSKAGPNDLQFTELKMTTNPNNNKPYISWKMSISQELAQQFNQAVAKQRQLHGSFSVPRIISDSLTQAFPNAYVAAAQPLAIG